MVSLTCCWAMCHCVVIVSSEAEYIYSTHTYTHKHRFGLTSCLPGPKGNDDNTCRQGAAHCVCVFVCLCDNRVGEISYLLQMEQPYEQRIMKGLFTGMEARGSVVTA